MNVFQHLDELKDSDGVGNDAIGLHNQFLSLGWNSHFVTRIPRKGKLLSSSVFLKSNQNYPFSSADVHILHYGGHGYPYEYFQNIPGKKILRFHNITPASFYMNTTTPEIYESMLRFESLSYLEIATLSLICDAAWCDSEYNAHTLKSFDFRSLVILPICKQYKNYNDSSETLNFNLCFVGRYSPQKKWEDLIEFFHIWKEIYPEAQLNCFGSVIGAFDGYFSRLETLVEKLSLKDSVHFQRNLSDEELLKEIRKNVAMVSMSEHEGFCLPLLEAFGMGVPVFAFDSCAVGTTMHGGGRLFKKKNFIALASEMKDILTHEKKKKELILNQRNSLEYYNTYPWKNALETLINRNEK